MYFYYATSNNTNNYSREVRVLVNTQIGPNGGWFFGWVTTKNMSS